MCPPSENIQKRRTDKLSARRPTFEGQRETWRRYTVNTGSDDDVETSPPPGTGDLLALFLLAIRSFRSPRTVKSVIIHICATEGNCTYVCICTTRSTVFIHEFIGGAAAWGKKRGAKHNRSPPNCRWHTGRWKMTWKRTVRLWGRWHSISCFGF